LVCCQVWVGVDAGDARDMEASVEVPEDCRG